MNCDPFIGGNQRIDQIGADIGSMRIPEDEAMLPCDKRRFCHGI